MKLLERPQAVPMYDGVYLSLKLSQGDAEAAQDLIEGVGEVDPGKDYEITIKQIREGRSLNANSYYFRLVRKCAEAKNITPTEYHNRNLAELSIPWKNAKGETHWTLQRDDDFWLRQKETHFCPTDVTEDRKGVTYRWFYLLKPSHLFDTKEMSRLIDGIVQDAKTLGIETMTPSEIERLKQLWKPGKTLDG